VGEFLVVCKSVGRRCGIAEQARYLAERLNAQVVPSSRGAEGRKDAVIVEFAPALYNSIAELANELRHASKVSPLVVLDCHDIPPWLWRFSRKCLICTKSIDVAATCGLGRVVVAGLLIPNLRVRHRRAPKQVILGCFGFSLPDKNFDKTMRLAERLGAKCKIVTSVATASPTLERLSRQYLSYLKAAANSNTEIIEVFGNESEIVAHLQDCSHVIFAEEYDIAVSSSMRVAALSGRPVIAMNTKQSREAGALLVDTLDDITIDYLKTHANTKVAVKDSFEDYARILGNVLLGPLYSQMAHHDSIYEDSRQQERIRWIKRNCIGRTVDVGCASGFVTRYIGAELGIDSRRDRVAYATLRFPMIRFKALDARKQSVEGFETIVFGEIVEHVDYEDACQMIRIWAAQKPPRILVTSPNASIEEGGDPALVQNPEHKWACTRDNAQRLVPKGYSYRLQTTTEGGFWLLRMDRA
jgi:2-polyprenyl-3-methyl-5-hydroxy-6-metoxy-1,4-benzoquinol methylase